MERISACRSSPSLCACALHPTRRLCIVGIAGFGVTAPLWGVLGRVPVGVSLAIYVYR